MESIASTDQPGKVITRKLFWNREETTSIYVLVERLRMHRPTYAARGIILRAGSPALWRAIHFGETEYVFRSSSRPRFRDFPILIMAQRWLSDRHKKARWEQKADRTAKFKEIDRMIAAEERAKKDAKRKR